MSKLVGYARVSGDDQNLNLQLDALLNAGVKRRDLYCDQLSSSSISSHLLLNLRDA